MNPEWSELVDTICDVRGLYAPEFADIAGAVETARHYCRDLRCHVLLQELPEDTLDTAALEADLLLEEAAQINSLRCPTVMGIAFTAHALLHGDAEGVSVLRSVEIEGSCRRVAAFILLEKMRRCEIYETMTVPWDPWDDDGVMECVGEDPARLAALKRWLGYPTLEGDKDVL